jgi:hypothetical protein
VVTDAAYWVGGRPDGLNLRQQVNASFANFLLAATGWARWLVHLDGDECLHLQRDELDAMPPTVRAVRLTTWEAVSSADADDVRLFKRQLTPAEHAVLSSLGYRHYFRGHRVGKTAVRPSFGQWLKVHAAVDGHGAQVPMVTREGLHLLHYEATNFVDFVRKWDAHRGAKGRRPDARKTKVAAAVVALLDNDVIDDGARQRLLRTIYDQHIADPVDLLSDLGYLVTPDPALHRHVPTPLSAVHRRQLDALLEAVSHVDKRRFARRHVLDDSQQVRAMLRTNHPALAEELPLL